MSIHTTTHAISENDSNRMGRDMASTDTRGGGVSPHSKARRAAGTVRRVFREINEAQAAVDRVNRPWVYQNQGRNVTRHTSR